MNPTSPRPGRDLRRLSEELRQARTRPALAAFNGGAGAEDPAASRAAYQLAACLGRCRLFGVGFGELGGTLSAELATSATERWLTHLAEWVQVAEGLPRAWSETTGEAEVLDQAAELLTARTESWAVFLAVDEAYQDTVEPTPTGQRFERALRSAVDALEQFDAILLANADALAPAAGSDLLANWRSLIAEEYRHALPWWLDGRLEELASRLREEAHRWLPRTIHKESSKTSLVPKLEIRMPITDRLIDQAFSDLKRTCGGVRNDYFGLLYLEREYDVPRDKAVHQVAFGGNDYGLDGFHFDPAKRNLYLFQFKYSDSPAQFKDSLQRLITVGMERIFLTPNQDDAKNQLLLQLRSCLIENRHVIDQVYFRFIFTGDPAEAENSKVLDKLREDLEDRKYLLDRFFHGRQVTLVVEFRSAGGVAGPVTDTRVTRVYPLAVADVLKTSGPGGETMHVGFVRLADLHAMHRDMGQRFFERNIRYGLGSNESVNRVLGRTFKQAVLEGKAEPAAFAFHHNGVTLAAQQVEQADGFLRVVEPRLLNGAQTVTTFAEFLRAHADNPALEANRHRLEELKVLCRLVTAAPEFVTAVTINNNRQNPVEPWNLRANDMIQLELQDRFADLGVYYERQENAFASLSYEEMEETGITEGKAVQLVRLAQTFLASDGQIDKFARFREVFEDEKLYDAVFGRKRLAADLRHVLLCYKIQFRLRKLVNEIADKGPNKYWYVSRARPLLWGLLCQAVLNDPDLGDMAERFGERMSIEADYTETLSRLATTRCRLLLSDLVADKDYAAKVAEDNLGFLRTNAAYKRCMEAAYKRWKWVEKKLK